jgi:hypothetical protein
VFWLLLDYEGDNDRLLLPLVANHYLCYHVSLLNLSV